MKVIEEVTRKEIKEKAIVNNYVPEVGQDIDKSMIPNAETLALTVINLIDKYMAQSNKKGGEN